MVGKRNQAFAIKENCNGWVGGGDPLVKCHQDSSAPFTVSAFELIDLLCNLIFSLMDAALRGDRSSTVNLSQLCQPNLFFYQ